MKKLMLVILMSLPISVFAGASYSDIAIEAVIVNSNTGVHFRVVGEMQNPDGCTYSSWYKVKTGAPYEKELSSLIMLKYAQGETVSFSLSGCEAGTYPLVGSLY